MPYKLFLGEIGVALATLATSWLCPGGPCACSIDGRRDRAVGERPEAR